MEAHHFCKQVNEAKLPLGEPMLTWSFNRDGEAKAGLVENETRMRVKPPKFDVIGAIWNSWLSHKKVLTH